MTKEELFKKKEEIQNIEQLYYDIQNLKQYISQLEQYKKIMKDRDEWDKPDKGSLNLYCGNYCQKFSFPKCLIDTILKDYETELRTSLTQKEKEFENS